MTVKIARLGQKTTFNIMRGLAWLGFIYLAGTTPIAPVIAGLVILYFLFGIIKTWKIVIARRENAG